jgi:hypothetical protein
LHLVVQQSLSVALLVLLVKALVALVQQTVT